MTIGENDKKPEDPATIAGREMLEAHKDAINALRSDEDPVIKAFVKSWDAVMADREKLKYPAFHLEKEMKKIDV